MASNLRSISTLAELNAFQQSSASAGARVIALGFWTRWSEPSLSMLEILATLSKQSQLSTALSVAKVEAEEAAELSEKFGIDSVPTTTFLVVHLSPHPRPRLCFVFFTWNSLLYILSFLLMRFVVNNKN